MSTLMLAVPFASTLAWWIVVYRFGFLAAF